MQTLVFDPESVLDVAERLSSVGDEASDRSAISRAYYGAFLFAREVAEIKDETSRAHFKTWKHYVDSGERQVAKDLWDLRSARNMADYRTDLNVPRRICDESLKTSRRVRSALKRISGRAGYQALSTTGV